MTRRTRTQRKRTAFEELVLSADPELVSNLKTRLLQAWDVANVAVASSFEAAKKARERLRFAIEKLDTEPGWFLNLNAVYRDVIEGELKILSVNRS